MYELNFGHAYLVRQKPMLLTLPFSSGTTPLSIYMYAASNPGKRESRVLCSSKDNLSEAHSSCINPQSQGAVTVSASPPQQPRLQYFFSSTSNNISSHLPPYTQTTKQISNDRCFYSRYCILPLTHQHSLWSIFTRHITTTASYL